jgi:hypothetical protein
MFMRFRGGGIGHKITREWDEFLQSDGAPNQQDAAANDYEDLDMESAEEDLDMESEEEFDEDADDEEDDGDAAEDEEDPDRVIPDSDEELDDDLLTQAGYGAL